MTEGELFHEYIIEASQAFTENHAEFIPKAPISFETEPVDILSYSVSCKVEDEGQDTTFCIKISKMTVEGLKTDLNLGDLSI